MKQHSLRTELILWSVGILLVYIGTQVIVTNLFAHSFATAKKEQEINALMTQLVAEYTDDPMEIYSLVEQAQLVNNLRIMIYSDSHLIYHSSSVGKLPDRSALSTTMSTEGEVKSVIEIDLPPFLDLLELENMPNGVGSLLQELESNVVGMEEHFIYEGQPRTILVWSSNLAIDETVQLLSSVNLRISVGVILLTVLGVIIFSRRLISPITQMEQVASRVADLDFTIKPVTNVRTRELDSLAQSIHVMSENLEEMITQLSTDNRSLWDKVENQEKLDRMRRQFVANISHEMKTPLSMLMMYSENLKLDLPNMDKEFYYDTIIQEASGLNAMVEQLLDTSAVENGLSQVDLQPMNLSHFVQEIVEKFLPMLEEYGFSQQVAQDIVVKGDGKYLEQAIRNYLNNAISHTKTGEKIALSLEREGEKAVFQVYNQGSPIAYEDLPYVWDSFYRADKSRNQTEGKRVGLGLYIVKTCISSHFGQVEVENRTDGVAFSFSLPLYE